MNNLRPCCYVFSLAGAALASRLMAALARKPWLDPAGASHPSWALFAPLKLCRRRNLAGFTPFENLAAIAAAPAAARLFIGALGIAVRALAPALIHKSVDAPVVVMDCAGKYAISVISGHWGGANSLATHLAALTGAEAVLTTASDALREGALDMLLRGVGLKILDWDKLPEAQARILEGEILALRDPWRVLPKTVFLERTTAVNAASYPMLIDIDWKKRPAAPGLLRVANPVIHIGLGFRRNVQAGEIHKYLLAYLNELGLEENAIAALATVEEKAPATALAASMLGCRLDHFPAARLALLATPNPSRMAGEFFQTNPFSVCEAAALMSAGGRMRAQLLFPKRKFDGVVTFACALAKPFFTINNEFGDAK